MSFYQNNIKPYIGPVELFVIAGPTLIGFIAGFWRYEPADERFTIAFQSFLFFLGYLALLTFNHFLSYLNFFSYANYVYYADSLFCIAYLAAGFWQYFKARNQAHETLPFTQKLYQKINI